MMVKSNLTSKSIRNLLLDIISNSKKPIILTKQYNISKQLISYNLKVLKDKNLIRKLDKGQWEIVKDNLNLTSKRIARGHAFIWKIKFHKKIKGWDKREQILTKLNIPFKKTGNTIRIKIKGKKVWLNNKTIIIYENKSFFDSTPLETRKMAIFEMISTIKSLENRLKLKLGKYNFTTKREHIAWVKDNLAIQCNKEGQKIKVIDKGELWMEVDNSYNQDETEFYKTLNNSALINSNGYNGYYNSHKKTNWKVTPEFILNTMHGIQQNQLIFDKNMSSHLKVLKELGEAVKDLRKEIKKREHL